MRSGIRGMGFSGGVCALPNWTGKQAGMVGMRGMGNIDWTALGTTLLTTAGQVASNYAPQQTTQPTVVYQQVPVPVQTAPASGSSNTALYIVLGLVAAGGLAWAFWPKRGR